MQSAAKMAIFVIVELKHTRRLLDISLSTHAYGETNVHACSERARMRAKEFL